MVMATTTHPLFTTMRGLATHHPAYQQAYFSFETGHIFGPYLYANHQHAEEHLVADFATQYQAQQAANPTMHGHHVGHALIYSVLSPCAEVNHMCSTLVFNLATAFPVNHMYALGYTHVYDGIPGHQSSSEQLLIRANSVAALATFAASPLWSLRQVP